jgi:hypothetical protein
LFLQLSHNWPSKLQARWPESAPSSFCSVFTKQLGRPACLQCSLL